MKTQASQCCSRWWSTEVCVRGASPPGVQLRRKACKSQLALVRAGAATRRRQELRTIAATLAPVPTSRIFQCALALAGLWIAGALRPVCRLGRQAPGATAGPVGARAPPVRVPPSRVRGIEALAPGPAAAHAVANAHVALHALAGHAHVGHIHATLAPWAVRVVAGHAVAIAVAVAAVHRSAAAHRIVATPGVTCTPKGHAATTARDIPVPVSVPRWTDI
mmetsp:Transcript_96504/g.272883  ORF Transcript_96504/g.272883 Transcript_96504/m.272883 type:complete len:220 (-) Transcript_96504:129-788(-)